MNILDRALEGALAHLTKEELIELIKELVKDGLHRKGPKKDSQKKHSV